MQASKDCWAGYVSVSTSPRQPDHSVVLQDAGGQHDSHSLPPGASETLQVEPVRKLLRTVVVGRGGAVEKAGNVIHLHFEGNWLPIKVCAGLPWQPGSAGHVAAGDDFGVF